MDDTDLYILDKRLQLAAAVLATVQSAITLWSSLLAAAGGMIKTEKSFWCMIDYVCNNGEWKYEPFQLIIAQEGMITSIPQCTESDADKTLGVLHCLTGGHSEHLLQIQTKAMEWLGQMKYGHLPPALVWKSYWAKLGHKFDML